MILLKMKFKDFTENQKNIMLKNMLDKQNLPIELWDYSVILLVI